MSDISAIDRAIAAAQARKAAKAAAGLTENVTSPSSGDSLTMGEDHPVLKRPERLSSEARVAKNAAREKQREVQKAERAAARAARRAEKEASKTGRAPHMSKVEKAAAALPTLSDAAQLTFNEVTANFTAAEITAIAAHLQHFNRVKATERALQRSVGEGDTVVIIGGNPKYVGMRGTVSKAQRIRCYVELPGVAKPVYLFTSDVELQSSEQLSVAV